MKPGKKKLLRPYLILKKREKFNAECSLSAFQKKTKKKGSFKDSNVDSIIEKQKIMGHKKQNKYYPKMGKNFCF